MRHEQRRSLDEAATTETGIPACAQGGTIRGVEQAPCAVPDSARPGLCVCRAFVGWASSSYVLSQTTLPQEAHPYLFRLSRT